MSESKINRSDLEQGIANCRLALELDGTIPATEVSQDALAKKELATISGATIKKSLLPKDGDGDRKIFDGTKNEQSVKNDSGGNTTTVVGNELAVDDQAKQKLIASGAASSYRIQDASHPLPEKSRNAWSDADSGFMDGVSGYSTLGNAVADLLLGREESVTGENYSSQAKDPVIVFLDGKATDAPGAEVLIKSPKIAAVLGKADLEPVLRETIDEEDRNLPIDDIKDLYEFSDSELEQIAKEAFRRKYGEKLGE